MWACPHCRRRFATRNQTHACARLGDLDQHFARAAPQVRATFESVLAAVSTLGPVEVLPEKTRIALHIRMSFAAFTPRRHWLNGRLVLARHIDSPRFLRIQELSPRNVLHTFRLTSPADVDAEFATWLAEAYQVGAQEHLHRCRWRMHDLLRKRTASQALAERARIVLACAEEGGVASLTAVAARTGISREPVR